MMDAYPVGPSDIHAQPQPLALRHQPLHHQQHQHPHQHHGSQSYSSSPTASHSGQPQAQHQHQNPHQQRQHWPSLLPSPGVPGVAQPFPSPPASSISEQGQHGTGLNYPGFFPPSSSHTLSSQHQQKDEHSLSPTIPRGGGGSTGLSLNISSLSVTSPTNLSPISAPPPPSSAGGTPAPGQGTGQGNVNMISPATPISPGPFQHSHNVGHSHGHNHNHNHNHNPAHNHSQSQSHVGSQHFRFDHAHPSGGGGLHHASSTPSLRSATSTRKRSFTASTSGLDDTPTTANVSPTTTAAGGDGDEHEHEHEHEHDLADMDMDMGMDPADLDGGGEDGIGVGVGAGVGMDLGAGMGESPVDEKGMFRGAEIRGGELSGGGGGGGAGRGDGGAGGGSGLMAKPPLQANNFVTKLYCMITDPKSASFISWTELGTSFVVSNVGEFSRTILGSHFKHNNFSSFVRQLNMYGFHKINRTPRAQRSSSDSHTWEFSHVKFLRGRPDLLDEIRRKSLEPDPAVKHRVELPGEVAAQLNAMREENRRVWAELEKEKRKSERLTGVVGRLWEVVGRGFPGTLPPFPNDLLDSSTSAGASTPIESPDIFVTSPTVAPSAGQPLAGLVQPTLHPSSSTSSLQSAAGSMGGMGGLHPMHTGTTPASSSPGSSPTAGEFPMHQHHQQHAQHQHQSMHHPHQHQPFSHQGFQTHQPYPPPSGSGRHWAHPQHRLARQHSYHSLSTIGSPGWRTDVSPAPSPVVGAGETLGTGMEFSFSEEDIGGERKRQRIDEGAEGTPGGLSATNAGPRRMNRARSDSAPLGGGYWPPPSRGSMSIGVGMGLGGGGMRGVPLQVPNISGLGAARAADGQSGQQQQQQSRPGSQGGPPVLSITVPDGGVPIRR